MGIVSVLENSVINLYEKGAIDGQLLKVICVGSGARGNYPIGGNSSGFGYGAGGGGPSSYFGAGAGDIEYDFFVMNDMFKEVICTVGKKATANHSNGESTSFGNFLTAEGGVFTNEIGDFLGKSLTGSPGWGSCFNNPIRLSDPATSNCSYVNHIFTRRNQYTGGGGGFIPKVRLFGGIGSYQNRMAETGLAGANNNAYTTISAERTEVVEKYKTMSGTGDGIIFIEW